MLTNIKNRVELLCIMAVTLTLASFQASAELPVTESAFTGISTDAGVMIGYVAAAVVAIAVGFKLVQIVKRGIRAL